MKAAPRSIGLTFFTSILFIFHSSQAYAACSRDDVSFYLGKGFSTEQITALCSAPAASASKAPQSETQSENKEPAQLAENDNEAFLKSAIKAKKIYLDNGSLNYTKKVCIEYGEEDLYGFTPKACPHVKFTIALKNLEIIKSGKKYYFYGTEEIRIKSKINREIIGNLEDQKPKDRELILDEFETGDETDIPVREDYSLDRVKQVLEDLAS